MSSYGEAFRRLNLMPNLTLFGRLAHGFGFSLRFRRRSPFFRGAYFSFALRRRARSRRLLGFLRFLRFLRFLCLLGFFRFLGNVGLSGLGLGTLVGADFCRTRVFILERVGVGGSNDAPGVGVVRHREEQ